MFRIILFVFLCFPLVFLTAQNLSSKELIKIWKTDDITQTIQAEGTYKDLKLNKNPVKLRKIIGELDRILSKENDERLFIRIVMYKTLAVLEFSRTLPPKQREELETAMKKAELLDDEQLMSELYTLYGEQSFGDIENNLFYLAKAVEIQEKIGVEYFPLIDHRFLVISRSYYILQEYEQCLNYAKKGFALIKDPALRLGNYCMFNDLIGASSYELQDAETSIEHYGNILTILKDFSVNYKKHEEIYRLFEPNFVEIWSAVAKGGIAKGYYLQKRYDEAVPLLLQNIESALRTKQLNDAAKAQNALAQIRHAEGDYPAAIKLWKESSEWAAKSLYSRKHLIESVQGISESFFKMKAFDSAYYYNNQYHSLKFDNFKKINESKLNSVNRRIEYEKFRTILANINADLQNQKNYRNLILVVFATLIIIGFFLYNRNRLRQNIRFQKLESQKIIAEGESAKIKMTQAKKQLKDFKEKLKLNILLTDSLAQEMQDETSVSLKQLTDSTILTDEDWQNFKQQFSIVFPSFIPLLEYTYSNITQSDIRYLCLTKLDLNHKEIATALGISAASLRVTWHRIRKKLEIDTEVSPHQFIEIFEKEMKEIPPLSE